MELNRFKQLLESQMGDVKPLLNEQSKTSLFSKGDRVKIPIKKNGKFIICSITGVVSSSNGITEYRFTVINSTYPEMEKGYSNVFDVYNNTYKLYSSEGEGTGEVLQKGPIEDIKKV